MAKQAGTPSKAAAEGFEVIRPSKVAAEVLRLLRVPKTCHVAASEAQ